MKKYVYIFLLCSGVALLLSACKSISNQEMVTTEAVAITEIEEPTSEEFTDDGEKITTFKISKKSCDKMYNDTTSGVADFIKSGTYWVLEDDYISVEDKDTCVELKMSESDIKACRERMFEYLGVGPSNKLEKDSFFYYNNKYDKIVAYVSKEERIEGIIKVSNMAICLETLQMLDGIDSDDWNIEITIINPETDNIVIEMNWSEKYKLSEEDWK